jgi:hypothetical protein
MPLPRETSVFRHFVSFQVFTNIVPFSGSSNRAAMASILQRKYSELPAHPILTEDLLLLVQRCRDDPNSRQHASESLGALKVLTCNALTEPERICLINAIFSDHNWTIVVNHISGEYAQNFVDVADEVSRQSVLHLVDKLIDGGSHFHVFSVRRWRASHQRFAGDVCPP